MRFKAPKGVRDILHVDSDIWHHIEEISREIFTLYGYREIRLPIFESTEVFIRSIGETTDIVEKEMYTFQDKGNRSLTLRPEGTASLVRAYIEHRLYENPPPQKFFYFGPMFRQERPQAGRFRQFYQLGVEALGFEDPMLDAETLDMLWHFFKTIDIKNLSLFINSIGCESCRPDYKNVLKEFIATRLDEFCKDCKRRFQENPLRILDCKVEKCIKSRADAPIITDFLCDDCRPHFMTLKSYLELMEIPYQINPNLVRGLDYYTKTTFEVTPLMEGNLKSVAAGGRYDNLVKEFGGPPTPGIGFAIGFERLAEHLKGNFYKKESATFLLASIGNKAFKKALMIARDLRYKNCQTEISPGNLSLKNQMKRADKMNMNYVLIIGDEELKNDEIIFRNMRTKKQQKIKLKDLVSHCMKLTANHLQTTNVHMLNLE